MKQMLQISIFKYSNLRQSGKKVRSSAINPVSPRIYHDATFGIPGV